MTVCLQISDAYSSCPNRRDLVDSRLFSAYSQTAAGLRQGGKGSGLGLALVRKIVKLCNGRLGVQSTPNQGSTFWVELALGKPPDHKIAAYQEALRLEEEAGKKHIATSSTPETTAQPIPAVVQAGMWSSLCMTAYLIDTRYAILHRTRGRKNTYRCGSVRTAYRPDAFTFSPGRTPFDDKCTCGG